MATLLVASLLLPLFGLLIAGGDARWARVAALVTSLVTLVLAWVLAARFPPGAAPFAQAEWVWAGGAGMPLDIRFGVALDGLSLWLYALTPLLVVVGILVSWETIQQQASLFYRMMLLLETGMMGVFVARDIILFYVFFEFTLLPLFFIIGIWGSEERRHAAVKFFLFTLAGSVLTLLGLLGIVVWNYSAGASETLTFSIPELTAARAAFPMSLSLQIPVFLALFAGFAIKVPLFPLHTWLPLAHVQAPAAGSVLLAGILLKIGTYGFVRFNIGLLPEATALLAPWILWLAVAGIVYGAMVALAQPDMKRLIAYSSVSHLGFVMAGLFAMNRLGMQGGVLQMVNHGLSTGGLFAIVGMLYERYHTRQIADLGGLARRLPVLAFFMLAMALASIGLPGLNGFAGEILILAGLFQRAMAEVSGGEGGQFLLMAVLATLGVVLGAWYMLGLVRRVFFGPLREPAGPHGEAEPMPDLSLREIAALGAIAGLVVWIGVCPDYFLSRMAPTLDGLTAPVVAAWERPDAERVAASLQQRLDR